MIDHGQPTSKETTLWLQERLQPGNWIDIAESDEIPNDIQGQSRTILHFFRIVFAPEIRRRKSDGELDENFVLTAAQMIQPEEGERIVRFNEEVRGNVLILANRPIPKGEPIEASDLLEFGGFELDDDELNCGHVTLFQNVNGWVPIFDLRAGRAKAKGMLDAAVEFLDTAQFASGRGHARASVDNLFSACECVSKVQLILHHSRAAQAKRHGSVHTAINDWGRLGNVSADFLELFNRMSNARTPARYQTGSQVAMPSPADCDIVRREIGTLGKQIAWRTKLDMFNLE